MLKYFRILFLILAVHSVEAVYINRFTTIDNGGVLFTGNTLGLSKKTNENQPGKEDSIGAFITEDLSSQVGFYLPGTTLVWQNNSSDAYLDLPDGSTVLYAELIWSGSYGFNGQITGNEPNTPITFITPDNVPHSVAPDPATAQVALTPGFSNAGNYTRSANVTTIVQGGGGAGLYIAGGIPATVSALDNTHNAAGWTLAVVFRNGAMPTSNMTIFVGCEQASNASNPPASVSGFCTPSSGLLNGNLFISAIEGDANKMGDRMLFGPTAPLTIAANSLSGDNNPINNFFASQINTLLPFDGRIFLGSGQLDTRGSFGNFNADPFTGVILPGSRQGYDITSVDISPQLLYNQTTAFAQGTTTGDDYTLNALGMQIEIGAPTLVINKLVNSAESTEAHMGDTVHFSFTIQNTGTQDATALTFSDILPPGILTYVPGTLLVNSGVTGGTPASVPLPSPLIIGATYTVTFDATVDAYPPGGNVIFDSASVAYSFNPCSGSSTTSLVAESNVVEIILPTITPLPSIDPEKTVNGSDFIVSSTGDVVTFAISITNTGDADAINVSVNDSLPAGLTLIPGSVTVDNVVVDPDPPLTNIPVGTVPVGQTVVVLFQAEVTGSTPQYTNFFNSAVVNSQYLNGNLQPVDLDPEPTNTVEIDLLVDPIGFGGIIHKCQFLNETRYCVDTTWIPAFSFNVDFYRIYAGPIRVANNISADATTLRVCVSSRYAAENLSIVAVYNGDVESPRYPIRILND